MSPISGIGAARAKYLECVELACSTGKIPASSMDLTIRRRASAYAVARQAGKTPEEAFEIAATAALRTAEPKAAPPNKY